MRLQWANISNSFRPRSGYEKTRSYFESNLFSDSALQQLHAINGKHDDPLQSPILCLALEFTNDAFYVATNKKFILFGTKSFHKDAIRKIVVDQTNFFFATLLKSIDNMNSVIVGLCDGSVKVLWTKADNPANTDDIHIKTTSNGTEPTNNINAKSCAIQNLIKEERKIVEKSSTFTNDKDNLAGHSDINMEGQHLNEHLLLHGLSSNQHYVKWMDKSEKIQCLFVHCGGQLRLYNFDTMLEVDMDNSSDNYTDAILTKGNRNEEFLVSLELMCILFLVLGLIKKYIF